MTEQQHELYEPKDFTNEEVERNSLAKMVVIGGLGICKKCGAGESELDDWPTCTEFKSRNAQPVATAVSSNPSPLPPLVF